ncbi:MAG: hypothetical protein KAV99_01755 [Candidatus Latescibacteria bacterium]|nr:hypothetical protein [Candidatus Latescibacterota bacterium]
MWGTPLHWGIEGLEGLLAIFGIFFLPIMAAIFIVWLVIRARNKRRQWEHEERMAMAEKGILPEVQAVEADLPKEESSKLDKILLAGIILAALGLMWIFGSFGFFLFLLGIGLIGLGFLHRGKWISTGRNRKFFISGVIIAAIGVEFWADSFGLFLLVLGLGLIGFFFLSQREKKALQPSASEPESEPQEVEQKAEEEQPEQQENKSPESDLQNSSET